MPQLFPGLEGEDLVAAIQNNYTPVLSLNETQVKEHAVCKSIYPGRFSALYLFNLAHYLPPGVDPSQWIYENGTNVNS
jgi:hypothetical protein